VITPPTPTPTPTSTTTPTLTPFSSNFDLKKKTPPTLPDRPSGAIGGDDEKMEGV
jgi:hypothetical protein